LAEPDARNVETCAAFDEDDFNAPLREGSSSCQAPDAATNNQHASDMAHFRSALRPWLIAKMWLRDPPRPRLKYASHQLTG
jgi:hypothetical protein